MANEAEEFKKIRDAYRNVGASKTFTALLMGTFSTGKTSLIGTGRKPILIDSFDPMGAVVLRSQIEKGEVLVRDWSVDDYKNPTAYMKWEVQWEKDIRSKFLANFGTYAIDSVTTFIQALSYHISKKCGRPASTLAIQDYNLIYATLGDVISLSSVQGCDFIMTAHLMLTKDDVAGEIIAEIDTFSRLKTKLPNLFSERYVLRKVEKSSGIEYEVLTNDQGRYRAGSKLASDGKIDRIEKPNLGNIMKKAGYPVEDKPLFL